MYGIRVSNMTNLFNKELLIYSLFDIHFSSPIKIMKIVYIFILMLFITLPTIYFIGFGHRFIVMFSIAIPIGLGHLMSKPIWNGKRFTDWLQCKINYLFSPKVFYDGRVMPKLNTYKINHCISVSRRKDLIYLQNLSRKEQLNG